MNLMLRASIIILITVGACFAYLIYGHYTGFLQPMHTVMEIVVNSISVLGLMMTSVLSRLGRKKQAMSIGWGIGFLYLIHVLFPAAFQTTSLLLLALGAYAIVAAWWLSWKARNAHKTELP
jgi:hypothetical protein